MHLNLLHLGRVSYPEGLRVQSEVVAARQSGVIADTLLFSRSDATHHAPTSWQRIPSSRVKK